MSKNALLNLNTFSNSGEPPTYFAIYLPELKSEKDIFVLTPEVMKWSQDVWLCHFGLSRSYWDGQREIIEEEYFHFLNQILESQFGPKYLCVFAQHPWQALIFLNSLQGRDLYGLYSVESLLNQKVYRNLSWFNWFSPLKQLSDHMTALRTKNFRASELSVQQGQLQRFIHRMNLKGPFELSQADESAVARRFSKTLGKAWRWTFYGFNSKQEESKDLFSWSARQSDLHDFPWISFEPKETPKVNRFLEYPMCLWDVVEPLLIEDFKKLCELKEWSKYEKVFSINWEITLYNLEEVSINIKFRHPYSLHGEKACDFKTALYQAHYAYVDFMNSLKKREEHLDLPDEIPFVSWKLKVTKRLYQSPQVLSIFPQKSQSLDQQRILDLQNKIPVLIENYKIEPDFFPSLGFRLRSKSTERKYPLELWEKAASKRPFFYYKKPRHIRVGNNQKNLFLERTGKNWWESQSLQDLSRDYYLVQYENKWIWVFQNQNGDWYEHGIFS